MTTHLLHAQGPVRAAAPEGFVPRLLARWLFRDASVAENRSLAPGLRRITLERERGGRRIRKSAEIG